MSNISLKAARLHKLLFSILFVGVLSTALVWQSFAGSGLGPFGSKIFLTAKPQNPALFAELKATAEIGQKVHQGFFQNPMPEKSYAITHTDQVHFPRLEQIIKQWGWPGFDLVGPEGSHAM